jgi:hypothetical protein
MPNLYPIGQTWITGDSEDDIELGSDLGARGPLLDRGRRSSDYLRERGARLPTSCIAELPALLEAERVRANELPVAQRLTV